MTTLEKFDAKVDGGILLGHSSSIKVFIIFNIQTLNIGEFVHVTFDENEFIIRNKESFVEKGYNQEEIIDCEQTYAPIDILEVIRFVLTFACVLDFNLYQIGDESIFLNGYIQEEICVFQFQSYEIVIFPDHLLTKKSSLWTQTSS